jgi:hypothetical protein
MTALVSPSMDGRHQFVGNCGESRGPISGIVYQRAPAGPTSERPSPQSDKNYENRVCRAFLQSPPAENFH